MIDKKINVSIGIAAYNAEKNISHLLTALLKQKEIDFNLEKIIVHSDNSTDKTVQIAKKFHNKKLIVIENKKRKGFAGSVKFLLESWDGQVIILFNDDIGIRDNMLINKLIQPFIREAKIGLVCGHTIPLPSKNFIEGAAISSFKAYDRMKLYIKRGNSNYSCDGKIMAFNKKFVDEIDFPKKLSDMGNTDAYMYLLCIEKKFKFRYVIDAIVDSRMPQNLSELIKWQTRNNSNRFLLKKRFGEIINQEYAKPPFIFWRCMFYEFIKNPLGCIFIFFFSFYIAHQAKVYSKKFNPTWDVITTSKKL